MQKGQIRVHTENIFPIIKKFLYSDHDIFLRELISNAVDASQKMKTLASIGEAKGELGDLRIDIVLDEKEKTLSIIDRGIGMTAEEVDKYMVGPNVCRRSSVCNRVRGAGHGCCGSGAGCRATDYWCGTHRRYGYGDCSAYAGQSRRRWAGTFGKDSGSHDTSGPARRPRSKQR